MSISREPYIENKIWFLCIQINICFPCFICAQIILNFTDDEWLANQTSAFGLFQLHLHFNIWATILTNNYILVNHISRQVWCDLFYEFYHTILTRITFEKIIKPWVGYWSGMLTMMQPIIPFTYFCEIRIGLRTLTIVITAK